MAMILSAFVSKFGQLLFDLAKEEVEMLWGVPGEIEKLQNKLGMINEVLADAERRRNNDRAIDYWLKQLKDVMYDADDILDLCRIEADKCSEGSSSTSSVRFSFPLVSDIRKLPVDHEIGMKIRELNKRLEEIWRWRSEFNLQISSPDMQQVTSQISRKTSSVGEIDIVGSRIEDDTRSLVDLLIKDDRRRNILVFAIVGAGGIGKTTLAQRIYNDQRIREEFQSFSLEWNQEEFQSRKRKRNQEQLSVKKWVCVSQEFDEINLLKDIYDGDKKDLEGDQSKSSVEPKVEKSLRGKKLFLVLDDVWAAKVWCDLLRNTLKSCAAGSRILVTTRKKQVAMGMMAVKIHHVDKLSLEDSWSLLCKKVVLTGLEREIQHLKDIGMEIVKKCDGHPLAIKAVAGVLCGKEKTGSAWNGVLKSTTWSTSGLPEEVKGALYLSYEDLPSYLKQCFIYCSLFPEDYVIRMYQITSLWIAEGFVKAEGSLTMEETAEEYYRELIMRNLLQPSSTYKSEDFCQMHDLLHSLGRYMARDESLVVTKVHKVGSSNGPMKLRRVYVGTDDGITDNEITEILDVLVKQDSLRTLIWQECPISETDQMDVVFNKLSRLRVLQMSSKRDLSSSKIQRLPDSLGILIHLRYLNISSSNISMIPETIGKLRNLQILNISYTNISVIPETIGKLRHLQILNISGTSISAIPESIGNLRNLHFLNMSFCRSLSRLPNSIVNLHNLRSLDPGYTGVVGMPAGLGRLQNLHTLREFMAQSSRTEGWCTLEELRSLTCLTDLSIKKLECITSSSEARAAQLRNKPKLRILQLDCTKNLQPSEEEMRRIEEVFEELHPPSSLEKLFIRYYFGHEFPKWIAETCASASILFPNLRGLRLSGCRNCKRLPPCGLLPNLQDLSIKNANSVIDVGPEFLVGGSSTSGGGIAGVDTSKYAFPRLKKLILYNMANWQEWYWDKGIQAMPCLKDLTLLNCPKLKSLPKGLLFHAISLTELTIMSADSLTTIENLLLLKKLVIINTLKLEKVSDLPALTTLKVENCPKLQVVENFQSLKRMTLRDYEMKSLPSYLLKGVHIEKLEIWCSMELIRNICDKDSPEWKIIQGIQQVHAYSEDESVHALYNKSPFSFTTNFSSSEMPSSSSGTTL